jgi:hypothetical protein
MSAFVWLDYSERHEHDHDARAVLSSGPVTYQRLEIAMYAEQRS